MLQRRRSLAALLAAGLVAAGCAQAAHVRESSPRRLAAGCVELMMSGECEGVFAPVAPTSPGAIGAGQLETYELGCETLKVTVLCGSSAAIDDELDQMGAQSISEQQDGPLLRRIFEWDEPAYEGPGRHGLALLLISEPTPSERTESLVMVQYDADAGLEFDARLIVDSVRPRKPAGS